MESRADKSKKKKKKKSKKETSANSPELITLLMCRKIDTSRFEPIGAGFFQKFEDSFNASVICIDRQKFISGEPYLIKIVLEDFTTEEYNLFRKKFEVIINPDYRNYYNLNITDVVMQSQILL